MNQFLNTVWGDADWVRCIVSGKMKHAFSGADYRIPIGKDVWFAPSLFADNERKINKVIATKAFWLDIDCGKPGCYESQIDAITALRDFVDHFSLPEPAVVNSGNGIHVWWVLDEYVTPEQWRPVATALREACVDQNLLADHGITIDIARIMRVPGTKNYKDPNNPKPVELMNSVVLCDYETMRDALSAFDFKKELTKNAEKQNSVFSVDIPQTPKDANKIAEGCNQLRQFRDTSGHIPEPQWYAGLGVVALCVDATQVANKWSSGHPDYSELGTTEKMERALTFAPTTCERFQDVNPEGCVGCPFQGKITSPIQLGETVTPLKLEPPKPAGLESLAVVPSTIPDEVILPKGYLCGDEGVYYSIIEEGEEVERKIVFTQPVWVSQVAKAELGGGSEVELSWIDANKKQCSASFKQSLLAMDSSMATWLLDQDISDYGNIKVVIIYIRAAISAFKKRCGATVVFDRFGLHEAGFVVGSDLITIEGANPAKISNRIDARRVQQLGVKGSLTEWSRASRLLDRDNWWMQRFAVLGALASPIYSIAGNEGSVLSLSGESGTGKTVSASFGVSAFGHPEAMTVDPNSTLNAFFEHWRQVNNLPLIVNEAVTMRKDYLGQVIYAAANGKARDTSTRNQEINYKGGWKTLTIFTSNVHLLDLPDNIIIAAQRNRILELSFDSNSRMEIEVGSKLTHASKAHHGEAGRILVQKLMECSEEVAYRVNEIAKKIGAGIHPDYRFGIWQIAANTLIAQIARALDLIEFEVDDAIENATNVLRKRSQSNIDPVSKVRQALDDYTNRYQESIGLRDNSRSPGMWIREARGEARGKWKVAGGKPIELCIAVNLFHAYALELGLDANYVRQWVKANDVKNKSERLADAANPIWCYIIPAEKVNYEQS